MDMSQASSVCHSRDSRFRGLEGGERKPKQIFCEADIDDGLTTERIYELSASYHTLYGLLTLPLIRPNPRPQRDPCSHILFLFSGCCM